MEAEDSRTPVRTSSQEDSSSSVTLTPDQSVMETEDCRTPVKASSKKDSSLSVTSTPDQSIKSPKRRLYVSDAVSPSPKKVYNENTIGKFTLCFH